MNANSRSPNKLAIQNLLNSNNDNEFSALDYNQECEKNDIEIKSEWAYETDNEGSSSVDEETLISSSEPVFQRSSNGLSKILSIQSISPLISYLSKLNFQDNCQNYQNYQAFQNSQNSQSLKNIKNLIRVLKISIIILSKAIDNLQRPPTNSANKVKTEKIHYHNVSNIVKTVISLLSNFSSRCLPSSIKSEIRMILLNLPENLTISLKNKYFISKLSHKNSCCSNYSYTFGSNLTASPKVSLRNLKLLSVAKISLLSFHRILNHLESILKKA
ncbi:uncharacterized protein ASCRUDRAFT_10556 [Ascoidea rubescens DSM 1968]|uniref:Uncharacterized protein n=1 Tax=Ascoidea rubescens DSM 1968 TaxID=1344418 RepID=A0A1D2V8Q9_9ASCO|nr:hypothetical protein ASCRUDRAFT_10556 [Ascoidea rubescens DSM 1968]ODV58091.1 hypothetical protein ASCRUDRAFT_10556 [Ascoidea rubescens DSM 1968]